MKSPVNMKSVLAVALLSMLSLSVEAARCPPIYEPEYSDDWPGGHDRNAVEARLAQQMLEIQRGLAIGQIPNWRAQSLFREQNWLHSMAGRQSAAGCYSPQYWQMLSRDLDFAWRHIQQSRRDCCN